MCVHSHGVEEMTQEKKTNSEKYGDNVNFNFDLD
jgi:hypothetical protein